MEFVMSDHIQKYHRLLAAFAFASVATISAPINAMSFFDAEEHGERVSAKMEVEKKEEVAAPAEPQPTALADGLNKIIDTLENPADVKHYTFTAVRGQKVMVREIPRSPEQSPWRIEYKNDQQWIAIHPSTSYISPALTPGQQVLVRVSKDPKHAIPAGEKYQIEIGSAPYLRNTKVTGDAHSQRYVIHFGKAIFVKKVDWSTLVVDSTQHPLRGVTVELEIETDQHVPGSRVVSQRISNATIEATFNLNTCIGKHTTPPFVGVYDFKTKWQLTYNKGYWFMYPHGNPDGGVGSRNGTRVPLVHICTQKTVG
jgi:hypothetical protein